MLLRSVSQSRYDGAPIIYTDREQGVLPAYNIRTDRWDIAENAMDKVNAAKMAKRDNDFGADVPKQTKDGAPSDN